MSITGPSISGPTSGQDDVLPFEPGQEHELRVHGVAGSTPESMLGLQAQPAAPAAPGGITVWRAPQVPESLRAWSWSSLTSGHWYQAFYLLLLPFMIANLAGWMLLARVCPAPDEPDAAPRDKAAAYAGTPRYRDGMLRVSTLVVRLAGLLVTGVFVVSFQLVIGDLVFWQWLYRGLGAPLWTVGLGTAATAALFAATIYLTRIRQGPRYVVDPWTDLHDPVGHAFVARNQSLLWESPGINVALRRLHFAAGTATIALLAAWPAGQVEGVWSVLRTIAFWLAVAVVALVLAAMACLALGDGTRGVGAVFAVTRRVLLSGGLLAVVLAALGPVGLSAATAARWVTLPAVHTAPLWIAAGVLACVLVLFVLGLLTNPGRRAVNAPSVLLLAASVGGAFGAGLASQTVRLLGGDCGPGRLCLVAGEHVAWLAIGVTTSLAVLVTVATLYWGRLARVHGSWRVAAHHLTGRGSWLTGLLGAVGVALAVAGVSTALARPGLPPPEEFPAWAGWTVVVLIVGPVLFGALLVAWSGPVTAARRAGRSPDRRTRRAQRLRVLAVLVVAAAVAAAVWRGWTVSVLGIALPPLTFAEFALDAAIVLPTIGVVTRIYAGLTDAGVRRGVGVLWDVGTFWPRWFHPLAPPTYSDRAVCGLAAQLDADLDVAGHRVLLAPHSQGSVIAMAAVLARPSRPHLALLTYGDPWQHLYAEFFPVHVNPASTAAVAARLGGPGHARWRNLHRVTDPIGGRIGSVPSADPMPDPFDRGHSDYWVEDAYRDAATTLRAALWEPPGA
jgi:hypothetical protein